MDPWLARAERLCYEGEEIVERIPLETGGVVVTTHRVMTFTPHDDGENFQHADLPNVEGVSFGEKGEAVWLERGVKLLLAGAVLGVAGMAIDLEGMVGDVSLGGAGGVAGLGGVLGMLQGLLDLLAILDDLLVLGGGLALLAAAGALGAYLWTRESTIRLAVAGAEDLTIATSDPSADRAVARLERALSPVDGATVGARESTRATGSDEPPA